ncbi:MAG: hypothetical protein ACFFCO_05625, partial [Promethearchaeota archaeon]
EAAHRVEDAFVKEGGSPEATRPSEGSLLLEEYARFDSLVDEIRRDLQEDSLTPEEKQEISTNIEEAARKAESASRLHRVGENISPPDERIVEVRTSSDSSQERHIMSQDTSSPDTGETTNESVELEPFRRIDDLEEYQRALRAFPDETVSPDFADLDYQVRTFFNVRRHFREGGPVEFIADSTGIPAEVIEKWMDGVERPELLIKIEQRVVRSIESKAGSIGEENLMLSSTKEGKEKESQEPIIIKVGDTQRSVDETLRQFQQLSLSQLARLAEYKNKTAIQQLSLQKPKTKAELEATIDRLGIRERTLERERTPITYKGIIRESARYLLKERIQADFQSYSLTDSDSPILRAADNPEFRKILLPLPGSRLIDVTADLLSLIEDAPDLASLTKISNYETYLKALQASPLVQLHPRFDEWHYKVKRFFQFQSLMEFDTILPQGFFIELMGLPKRDRDDWLRSKPPKFIGMLQRRAEFVKEIRRLKLRDGGLESIKDVEQRIDTFALKHHIVSHPKYMRWVKYAERYLIHRNLAEAGFYPRDLRFYEIEERAKAPDGIRLAHRPYLVHIAASIPHTPPEPGYNWLPVTSIPRQGVVQFTDWIQVPPRIIHQEQIDQLLVQLHPPTLEKLKMFDLAPKVYNEWEHQLGPLCTLEECRLAFAYLIGASLSDGGISKLKITSSAFEMNLSSRSSWSKGFGDRVAYYWTRFGVPVKQRNLNSESDQYHWRSNANPLLTWFSEAVLCLPPGGNHTQHISEADWIYQTDRAFRIKVTQGLSDGDGWVDMGGFGIAAERQGSFVEPLLQSLGFSPYRGKSDSGFNPFVGGTQQLRLLSELPVFLSASGRQESLVKLVRMRESARSKGNQIEDLPLIRLIQKRARELPQKGQDVRIREEIFDNFGVTIAPQSIKRIIEKGLERLRIDEKAVKAYVQFLKLRLSSPTESVSSHSLKVREETGYTGSLTTYSSWARGETVPRAVKRAISDNHPLIDKELLEAYPHLQKYKSLLS